MTDMRACIRIEALKTQNRLEAQRGFNNLSRNLRLLNLEATPEIIRAAAQEISLTLAQNGGSSEAFSEILMEVTYEPCVILCAPGSS